jgi:hypothetical protein
VPPVLLARGDDQRRAGPGRIREVGEPVGEPADRVQVHEGRPPGHARVSVRHSDRRRLLQREDVLDVGASGERIHERQLGRPGIPEDVPDALVGERFEQELRPGPSHGSN